MVGFSLGLDSAIERVMVARGLEVDEVVFDGCRKFCDNHHYSSSVRSRMVAEKELTVT